MGNEQIKAFVEKASTDAGLKQKLENLPKDEAEVIKAVVKIANDAGYHFSEQDWHEAHKNMVGSGEITQEDLDKVSGGTLVTLTIIIATTTPPIINITLTICKK